MTMDLMSETPAIIEFGHYRIAPHRRELLVDGLPIQLGGRTFDVLMALIEGQGAVVQAPAPLRPLTNLTEPVSELIGRDVEFEEILGLSAAYRLVTLTGAGG